MREDLTGRQFELIQAIAQNDIQQFCDLGGIHWNKIDLEINEDKLFPLALAVIYGHKLMA